MPEVWAEVVLAGAVAVAGAEDKNSTGASANVQENNDTFVYSWAVQLPLRPHDLFINNNNNNNNDNHNDNHNHNNDDDRVE